MGRDSSHVPTRTRFILRPLSAPANYITKKPVNRYRFTLRESKYELCICSDKPKLRPYSAYHDTCIPKDKQRIAAAPASNSNNYKEAEFGKCDAVTQDSIWKQSVAKEENGKNAWDTNWGFLAEFDEKGNIKQKEPLPEQVSQFSEYVPNTNAANYGSRTNTETGKLMANLEFKFNSHNRRKKLDNEMVCY